MMLLELSDFVEGDLEAIADYIAEDNPRRAVTFIREIRSKFNGIQRNPFIYQIRLDIGDEARMATIGNYAILFQVIGNIVRIERVAYGGRDLPDILDHLS